MKKVISLSVICPYCKKSLIDEEVQLKGFPSIKLTIRNENNIGTIHLCSVYESFEHKCDIPHKNNEIVELSCPHCHRELLIKEECHLCGAPMVSMMLETGGRVSICSRIGCYNHYVAFRNIANELPDFYKNYED